MKETVFLETGRLLLRAWREEDVDPFAEMCADPCVMRYFPEPLSREKSVSLIARCREKQRKYGFSIAPVEVKATGEFLGFVGLSRPDYATPLPFEPCVEIGWRLKQSGWGKGYASEAARAWLRFGFETIGLQEIVAFTIPDNTPSQKVMQRIGMTRDHDGDFLFPGLPPDHPVAPHVLYRLARKNWQIGTDDG
ncbi:GNAT family N-acetyltransferase [Roseibium marinum]|uniref:RimJ/RimL family protein N-acetyltransferase n=1 Tax=Roseibium marinum TaxID=281252 RepID=A0A2S3UYU2_9HYPH|nr:GNAT family N-acetyltransferase [Roseibium marinum]POF32902.1 RimJ/RimL family protein N-acetyltransferase [Roseibium marinum]